jgi:hypothetical protein
LIFHSVPFIGYSSRTLAPTAHIRPSQSLVFGPIVTMMLHDHHGRRHSDEVLAGAFDVIVRTT